MPIIAQAVYELIDRITAAATVEAVWDSYLGIAQEAGLEFGIACFIPPPGQNTIEIVAEALPENWLSEYYGDHLWEGDLLAERARNAMSSFAWSMDDWDTPALTPVQRRWRDHNLHRGILSGLSILDFRRGQNMLMVLCGRENHLHAHDRLALDFAGHEALLRLRALAVHDASASAALSQRERECLQWAAAGKTDWEISRILSLSEKTVNIYMERAKAKFRATTRAQAVVMALRDGIIAA